MKLETLEVVGTKVADVDRYTSGDGVNHKFDHTEHVGADYQRKLLIPFVRQINQIPLGEAGLRILDLSSGKGEAATFFAKRLPSAQVISSDISMIGLSYADGLRVRARAEELPFATQSISAIHFKDALVHICNRKLLFAEISRVLQPKGIILITSQEVQENYYCSYGVDGSETYYRFGTPENYSFEESILNKRDEQVGPPYFQTTMSSTKNLARMYNFSVLSQFSPTWRPPEGQNDWHTRTNTRFVLALRKTK